MWREELIIGKYVIKSDIGLKIIKVFGQRYVFVKWWLEFIYILMFQPSLTTKSALHHKSVFIPAKYTPTHVLPLKTLSLFLRVSKHVMVATIKKKIWAFPMIPLNYNVAGGGHFLSFSLSFK